MRLSVALPPLLAPGISTLMSSSRRRCLKAVIAGEVRHTSRHARGSVGRQTRRPFLCPQQLQQEHRGGQEFIPCGKRIVPCSGRASVRLSVCPKASMRLWPGPWSTQKYRRQHVCAARPKEKKNYFTTLVQVLDTLMAPCRCCPAEQRGPDVADRLVKNYQERQGGT